MDSTSGAAAEAGWVTARTGARGFRTEVTAGKHAMVVDEPESAGGSGDGATPYDYLLAAVGACTAMTLRMYASRKGWPLEAATVRFRTARSHAADCADCETKPVGVGRLERQVELRGSLTDEQRQRLLAIADRCPVKQTLERGIQFVAAAPGGPDEAGRPRVPDRETNRPSAPDERADERTQADVDEAIDESFPASDPPGWEPLHPGGPGEHPTPGRSRS